MPHGIKGPRTKEPTPENMKLVGIDFYHRYKEDIRLFANQTIETLIRDNPRLLIYPQCLSNCNDDLKKQYILSEYESVDSTQHRIMHISTGNIIGFIGSANTNISICSRFTGNSELREDFFLHYMLSKDVP